MDDVHYPDPARPVPHNAGPLLAEGDSRGGPGDASPSASSHDLGYPDLHSDPGRATAPPVARDGPGAAKPSFFDGLLSSAPWTRKAGDASASDPPAPGGAGGRAGAEGAGPKPPSTPNGITGDPARTPARATEAAYPDIATPGGARRAKFARVLSSDVVDLEALRDLAWSGIPSELRPQCWRILLGYASPNRHRQHSVLAQKRREYQHLVTAFVEGIPDAERTAEEVATWKQVSIDAPRTAPEIKVFHCARMQTCLRRLLFLRALRSPGTGYVQGLNDIATGFLGVFLPEQLTVTKPMHQCTEEDVTSLPEASVMDAEADTYWCLSRLLDNIHDHYTSSQPGIQRTVFRAQELCRRIDQPLAEHLEAIGINFLQFAFRWINCLLIREVPFPLAPRLFDSFLAALPDIQDWLVYLCTALLVQWTDELRGMDFGDAITFLQNPPMASWSEADLDSLLSRAYLLRTTFRAAPSHLYHLQQ